MEVRQRTRKKDWKEQSRRIHGNIMRDIPEAEEGTVIMPPPWRTGVPGEMKLTETQKAEVPEEQRRKAEEALDGVSEVDLISYTDGSAEGGVTRGGGADVVTYRAGVVVRRWSGPAGAMCSSYGAELTALTEAVRWLEEEAEEWRSAALVTDSRSLVEALQGEGVERRLVLLS